MHFSPLVQGGPTNHFVQNTGMGTGMKVYLSQIVLQFYKHYPTSLKRIHLHVYKPQHQSPTLKGNSKIYLYLFFCFKRKSHLNTKEKTQFRSELFKKIFYLNIKTQKCNQAICPGIYNYLLFQYSPLPRSELVERLFWYDNK